MPFKSAILEQYPFKTIRDNHVGMTKFGGRDSGYRKISIELKRWIKEMKAKPGSASEPST